MIQWYQRYWSISKHIKDTETTEIFKKNIKNKTWIWFNSLEVQIIAFFRLGRKVRFSDKWVCIEREKVIPVAFIGLSLYLLTKSC